MMDVVALNEAKTHLSELVLRVEAGEEIIIRRGRHRVARLVAERTTQIAPPSTGCWPRPPDGAAGRW